jgi:hypothetical protein
MTMNKEVLYDIDAWVLIPWHGKVPHKGRAIAPLRKITLRNAAYRCLYAELAATHSEEAIVDSLARARVRVVSYGGVQCVTIDAEINGDTIFSRFPVNLLLVLIRAGIYPSE